MIAGRKIVVSIIVYNRFENVVEWIRCWQMCDTHNAHLVVIHNYDKIEDCVKYKELCLKNNVTYVPRKNVGMDIGALQDVFNERLPGFDNIWDYLIWCTDDTIPMRKDFVHRFISQLKNNIGVTCMELSKQVRPHIRTTGFCITKNLSKKIKFPADPMRDKVQCYDFEHRSRNNFLDQVNKLGFQAIQVDNIRQSPLWDRGRHISAFIDRSNEHCSIFPNSVQSTVKVTFICLIYNSFPEIISSLINQTHRDWELILIHDGPETYPISKIVDAVNDHRIRYIQTEERKQSWGHPWRSWAIQQLKNSELGSESEYVVITNADNHHVPTYCEYLVKALESNKNMVAAYCSDMIHNYINWQNIKCKLECGYLDCAGVMVRRSAACEVGWNHVNEHSADWLYFNDLIKKFGKNRFVEVKGTLLIHN